MTKPPLSENPLFAPVIVIVIYLALSTFSFCFLTKPKFQTYLLGEPLTQEISYRKKKEKTKEGLFLEFYNELQKLPGKYPLEEPEAKDLKYDQQTHILIPLCSRNS